MKKMSNNDELSSLFTFLSNSVKTLEIPKESPITCSVEDTPLENQVETIPEIIEPHKSTGAENLGEFLKNIIAVSAQIPTEDNSLMITPAREDNKSLLRLSENRSSVNRSTKHGNSPTSNNPMYTKETNYYACQLCDAKFFKRKYILEHIRRKHSNLPSSTEQKPTINQISE
ncbi:hypothetical protein G9C98_004851, partial [Cotesia typhae]